MDRTPEIICDMGEGYGIWEFGSDAALMEHITMANIACGGHAGDPLIMSRTLDMAAEAGVKLGAHPGFFDKTGFGRNLLPLDPDEVAALLIYQIGALQGFIRAKGLELSHVFPHGALYGYLSKNDDVAVAAARAIHLVAPDADILWTAPVSGSVYATEMGSFGHHIVPMVVADMKYTPDGSVILERGRKQATDLEYTRAQTTSVFTRSEIVTTAGTVLPVPEVEALLFHSDGPNAVAVATTIHDALNAATPA